MVLKKINPLVRAVATMAAVATLATGVTFAALQNTATLSDNSILTSDIDGLVIDSNGDNTFNTTDQGFQFDNIGPGGTSSPHTFTLKNSTDVQLDVNVQITGESALPDGVDATDLTFNFTTPAGTVTANWGQLTPADGVVLLNDLNPGESADITVTVSVDPSVGDNVQIPPFNLTFGNVAPVAAPTNNE